MLSFIKRLFCRHEWKTFSDIAIGATLGASSTGKDAVPHYEEVEICERCGKTKVDLYILPERADFRRRYNEKGWVVDEQGEELPIWDDRVIRIRRKAVRKLKKQAVREWKNGRKNKKTN